MSIVKIYIDPTQHPITWSDVSVPEHIERNITSEDRTLLDTPLLYMIDPDTVGDDTVQVTQLTVKIYVDLGTSNPMVWNDITFEGDTEKFIKTIDRTHLNYPIYVIDEATTSGDVIGIESDPLTYDEVTNSWVDHTAGELNVQTKSGQIKKIALLP